jgi:integrase
MTVEPVRNKIKIKQLYNYLNGKCPKYGVLYKFGLNTGLRISDILPIKVRDIFGDKGEFLEYFVLNERKTMKGKKIKLNDTLRKVLAAYVENERLLPHNYLFSNNRGGCISRVQAYRVLKESAGIIGIQNFGTHSLRKTWGYWTYKISKYNIGLIMDVFNHSSVSITLRYIGISQDQKDELYSLVQL